MSNAKKYVIESLGSTGFAVLRGQVAYTQRPDLWATASDCTYDFADKSLSNKLGELHGCTEFLVRFHGIESGLIRVLARSSDQLAQRIEWVTGYKVRQLALASELVGTIDPNDIAPRKISARTGDIHADVVTAQPGRTCSACEWFTSASSCSNAKESGILHPAANIMRRCKAYRPEFKNMDGRTGTQLWPELWTLTAATK
jgi:hypothetical protein